MSWWGYALLSASCWGMQYVLLEIRFRRLPFAAAYSFLSLANGNLGSTGFVSYISETRLDAALAREANFRHDDVVSHFRKRRLFVQCLCYPRQKTRTFASLLEITYPIFIILFTAVLLREFHLSFVGSIGAALILVGGAIVVLSRGR
jgi:hypothetical protein